MPLLTKSAAKCLLEESTDTPIILELKRTFIPLLPFFLQYFLAGLRILSEIRLHAPCSLHQVALPKKMNLDSLTGLTEKSFQCVRRASAKQRKINCNKTEAERNINYATFMADFFFQWSLHCYTTPLTRTLLQGGALILRLHVRRKYSFFYATGEVYIPLKQLCKTW